VAYRTESWRAPESPVPPYIPNSGARPPFVQLEGFPSPVQVPFPSPAIFRRVEIPAGTRGTIATLEIVADLAKEAVDDPYFVEEARAVVRDCGSKNYECDANAILEFVKTRTDYRPDPIGQAVDYISSPAWVLYVSGVEDCESLDGLILALNMAAGHGAMIRGYQLEPDRPGEFTHVVPFMGIREGAGVRWIAQDPVPTPARVGWEPPESEWLAPPVDLILAMP
jgi:hypothetical protein